VGGIIGGKMKHRHKYKSLPSPVVAVQYCECGLIRLICDYEDIVRVSLISKSGREIHYLRSKEWLEKELNKPSPRLRKSGRL